MTGNANEVVPASFADIVKESLLWTTVPVNEILTGTMRFEAGVYGIEGKHAREVLNNCKWEMKYLHGEQGIANAYHKPRFKRIFLEHSDLPIFQPSQITDLKPQPGIFISHLTPTNLEALKVKKGQVLLTCSGTVGTCTYVGSSYDDKIFSHDLIRITANNEVDGGYIYTFLKTKIGNTLITTNNYGAVVQHIEPEHLASLRIPYADEAIRQNINSLIKQSFELRDKANELISSSEAKLIDELKLPHSTEITSSDIDGHSVRASDLNGRFEAGFHHTKIDRLIDMIAATANEVLELKDPKLTRKIKLPGRFARVYVEEGQGTVFFGGKQIYELDPSNKKYLSPLHNDRIKEELELDENTLLVTRSGTIGRVQIVPKHWEGWVINEHVIRVIPASDDIAGYLYIWLQSPYGQELIKRFTYGAVVFEIDDNQLSKVAVPILKNAALQDEINSSALLANQLRYEAYLVEQKAIDLFNSEVLGL